MADNPEEGLAFISSGRAKSRSNASGRHTLDKDKLHLDTCSTFHQVITEDHVKSLHKASVPSKGGWNTGITTADYQGCILDALEAWISEEGIANLASFNIMEESGWTFTYKTGSNFVGTLPNGVKITLKRDKGICKGFPCVNLTDPEI